MREFFMTCDKHDAPYPISGRLKNPPGLLWAGSVYASATNSAVAQLHQVVEQTSGTVMDRQPFDLAGDRLARLELLETQHDRVLGHDPCGVEQRTRCVRLFTAPDHVRLGLLLGGDHLIEDLAHLARQDHVLELDGG